MLLTSSRPVALVSFLSAVFPRATGCLVAVVSPLAPAGAEPCAESTTTWGDCAPRPPFPPDAAWEALTRDDAVRHVTVWSDWAGARATDVLDSRDRERSSHSDDPLALPRGGVVITAPLSFGSSGSAAGRLGFASLFFPSAGPTPGTFERSLLAACRCLGEHVAARAARSAAGAHTVVGDSASRQHAWEQR